MVCRAAFGPCRRCAGQARARKAEATMRANGTWYTKTRGVEIDFRRDPAKFKHEVDPRGSG